MTKKALLIPALFASSLSACATAPPLEGVYCAPGQDKTARRCRSLVETDKGVWVASTEGARLASRATLTLRPPDAKGGPWQLVEGQQSYTQIVDPLLERVVTKLKGRQELPAVEHASHANATKRLIIENGIFIRLFDTTVGSVPDALHLPCLAGFLLRDQTSAEPAGRDGKARAFYFRELDRSVEACPNLLATDRLNAANGQEDVLLVQLHGDEKNETIEVVLTGSLGMFVPEGTSPAAVEKVRRDFGPGGGAE